MLFMSFHYQSKYSLLKFGRALARLSEWHSAPLSTVQQTGSGNGELTWP